nr:immunoglobulin light chain junction region [Macaca mulatta]MOY04927.1 immunoglobulin light chain junction region [Macaca mulatta]MOY05142.1 immunoglobulin light chain junction region [Macaca mulatta]MOY05467.1 immunoglobulin light chain junction region [Macaca mulatta]MOY05591.1 immunoglobulin light chain junction region [Macaca mulatta]
DYYCMIWHDNAWVF